MLHDISRACFTCAKISLVRALGIDRDEKVAPDKSSVLKIVFSYFSTETYVVHTHLKCLGKAPLISTTIYVFMQK